MNLTDRRKEEGEPAYLARIYPAFAGNDGKIIGRIGRAVREVLESYTVPQLIKLDKQFRQYTSLEWWIEWKEIRLAEKRLLFESDEDYQYALILGTFHPNGYYRESCTYALSEFEGMLPIILLRLNDWVAEVRKTVILAAEQRISKSTAKELLESAYTLDVLRKSRRRKEESIRRVEQKIAARLGEVMREFKLYQILRYDFRIRRVIYQMLSEIQVLDIRQLNWLLEKEKHGSCKQILIQRILSDHDCTMRQVDLYLESKSPCVRMQALQYKYSQLSGAWDGLEKMLLDKHHGIRELAAYILTKHRNINIREFYQNHLKDEVPDMAVIGLSEVGERQDWNYLLPFLNSSSVKTLKYTIEGLGRFSDFDGYDLYWNYLFDERISISKAAYCAVRSQAYRYGSEKLYREFLCCENEHTSRYLLNLLLRENVWESMPYLILLYGSEKGENQEERILSVIKKRNQYQTISQKQAERIKQALEEKRDRFPMRMSEQIVFDFKYVVRK